ncbi:hypothetical protein [Desulfitobacterium chlororespirans]|uniref:Outer membrane efflux protein n=1 Tax=Desulfitobacterium chlororespirans DSM 11544 TaxID=1121395 RepID=A0A1M7TZG7_9FIRM|nr:hypothetical protein [Desulfitobacterium chlororespirans]SHN76114.1 hypothetical protein SAMN02745215_02797 [Desulfitobacterium chlororespirans DSM 11544]
MKHWIMVGSIGLLLMIPLSKVWASEENTRLTTLGEAVQAAQTLYLQGLPPSEPSQNAPSPETRNEAGAGGSPEAETPAKEQEEAAGPEAPGDQHGDQSLLPEDEHRAELNQVALDVALVVLDLDGALQKKQYLIKRQEALAENLAQAEKDFKMGKIKAELRDELKKEGVQIGFDLNLAKLQVETAEKSFMKLTGQGIAEKFQYPAAYLILDGGKLALPSFVDQQADGEEIRKKFSGVLAAFGELGEGIAAYIKAGEQVARLEQDFKMGKAEPALLKAAREEKDRAWMGAFEKKSTYAKALYELDCHLEGYLSREVKKVAEPIFRGKGM